MLRKLPIVGIFGRGAPIASDRKALAYQAGAMIARLGCHLLTGGGYGVMEAACEGFTAVAERRGLSIGIVPRLKEGAFDEPNRDIEGRAYPNGFVEIAIHTPLPSSVTDWTCTPSRNHVNVLSADAFVALPGGPGTQNELDMAGFYRGEAALSQQQRKTVLLGPAAEFSDRHRAAFLYAAHPAEARDHLVRILSLHGLPHLEIEEA